MTLLLILVVALVAGVPSFLIGRARGINQAIPTKKIEAPMCGCNHHLSRHDPGTGKCHEMHQQPTKWDYYGDPEGYQTVECTCRQYVGPIPDGSLILPPTLPGVVIRKEING